MVASLELKVASLSGRPTRSLPPVVSRPLARESGPIIRARTAASFSSKSDSESESAAAGAAAQAATIFGSPSHHHGMPVIRNLESSHPG